MDKIVKNPGSAGKRKSETGSESTVTRSTRKMSEYGKHLAEKQKVKEMYGMREKHFRRFFENALKMRAGATGENLLSFLERRLDNVIYRLKLAKTRRQARQIITHGHVFVNGNRVSSPSFLVSINDIVTLGQAVADKKAFVEQVVDKRLKMGIKVPDWLELNKDERKGIVLRFPVRSDIQAPIEEHLIIELYSK